MSDNKKRILDMLAENKISADDAYRLLSAVDTGESERTGAGRAAGTSVKEKAKYLRVTVLPTSDSAQGDVDRVNIRVPMSLIRAGIKLTSLIPPEARDKVDGALREKGIDFDMRHLKPEDLEDIIEALSDLEVDVVSRKGEKVRVFVE